MFTYYKLGPHVLKLEQRPCVLGVSHPIVIKWLKPGWRDEWDEIVRRMRRRQRHTHPPHGR